MEVSFFVVQASSDANKDYAGAFDVRGPGRSDSYEASKKAVLWNGSVLKFDAYPDPTFILMSIPGCGSGSYLKFYKFGNKNFFDIYSQHCQSTLFCCVICVIIINILNST